jgi:rubrerythrin
MSTTEMERQERLRQSERELWCGGCGYGVVVRGEPPECPICRERSWRGRPMPMRFN